MNRSWFWLAVHLAVAGCEGYVPVDIPPEEGPPRLESIEPRSVRAGTRVRLTGGGFRPEPSENLVLFDGFRGRVVTASQSVLEVDVPPCLPQRRVSTSVTVGTASSESVTLDVEGPAAPPIRLEIGGGRTLEVVDGTECIQLAAGATYLLVTQSAGIAGGGLYGFSLRGVSPRTASTLEAGELSTQPVPSPSLHSDFRARLRRMEDEALARLRADTMASRARAQAAAPPPRVGDVARFRVVDGQGRFQEVQSVARFVGSRVAFYVDVEATTGAEGLSEADLRTLAGDLDNPVFPLIESAFGAPSDLDGNERVIVLLTPAINRLTPRGTSGFVGGFFFGVDLVPSSPNSNGAELLYAMVPDPQGRFGDPRSRELVLSSLPAILAHELQHLVHYNERMLVRRAPSQEAVWLSEALAQSAETLVGDSLQGRGDEVRARRYLEPTYQRARLFLRDPRAVSLLISVGLGSLEERGAGWLFLRYLQGHHPGGGVELLRNLTRTTRQGLVNLETATRWTWYESFSDWSVATYMDGWNRPPVGRLHYSDFNLQTLVPEGAAFPLAAAPLSGEFEQVGTHLAASSAYFVLASEMAVAVRLADRVGGAPPPTARFILRVVRLQ